jgi:SAM-dependent methyltransferase
VSEPAFLTSTRESYDAIATDAAEKWKDELAGQPLDRAMLATFAELVLAAGGGPVADIGCGTGRVTGHLHGLGVDVFGIDLSPGMLAIARRDHPGLRFDVGSMTALDLPDAALAGLMAYYSTIHVPDELLPQVFAEFHRVLAPGGHALLAFQVGDEPLVLSEAWGHEISLVAHRRRPERVGALLADAGLPVHAHAVRVANADERTPHAYLLARKPVPTGATRG